MSFRHTASFALCAATGLTMIAAPASACDNPSCFEVRPAAVAEPTATATAAPTPAKPLALGKFVHRPIATAAVRTVKTPKGHYLQVAVAHHRQAKTEAKHEPKPLALPARPEVAAAPTIGDMPPAAAQAQAQAFASIPYATARVRVVTPEDLKEIDAQATQAAFEPAPLANNSPVMAYNGVQVVSADDVNAIDLKAGVMPAALGVAAAPDKARSENATLLQRMLLALGGAFATAAAAVKALIG